MEDLDYYELFGLKIESTQNEIRKAYYKKALKYHPDKTKDEDKIKIFLKLTKAYETLSDPKKKREYDEKIKAKLHQKERIEKFDSKRRQMKEDLDLKERAYKRQKTEEALSKEQLKNEINRLREEGIRILNQAMEEEKANEEKSQNNLESQISDIDKTLILKWKIKYNFTQEDLDAIFSKYGDIDYLKIKYSKKKGTAVIQFKSLYSAYSVIQDKQDKSNKLINKIDIEWAQKDEPKIIKQFENSFKNEYKRYKQTVETTDNKSNNSNSNNNNMDDDGSTDTKNSSNNSSNKISSKIDTLLKEQNSDIPSTSFSFSFNATEKMNMSLDDYENYTLMKMRKLEKEKKKEDILKENNE
ncbi:DnaJ-domain-containing protein [Piromyces finnis]|uniref:DnaJ-domain-containing protein n=1 Tax=Piromyces finnis TaxID=1754191 RepID=A0A1Y1V1M6_9FUNG|nr:DnaJ-domain-containing protein [Piromyces finnis]|eukprot:ORX45047.1 DnaJ-domain-containing protein [Piromyces finnis]